MTLEALTQTLSLVYYTLGIIFFLFLTILLIYLLKLQQKVKKQLDNPLNKLILPLAAVLPLAIKHWYTKKK
jgi:tellurite resistance protein TehA-like permease